MPRVTYFHLTDATLVPGTEDARCSTRLHAVFEVGAGASPSAGYAVEFVRPLDMPAYVDHVATECRAQMRSEDFERGGPFLYIGFRGPYMIDSPSYAILASAHPLTFTEAARLACQPYGE